MDEPYVKLVTIVGLGIWAVISLVETITRFKRIYKKSRSRPKKLNINVGKKYARQEER